METRRLALNDLDNYFKIRLDSLKDSPLAFLTTYEEELERGNGHFRKTLANGTADSAIFGSFSNGMLVGVIGIYRDSRPKISHKANVWGMFVTKEFRKMGIAKSLVRTALEFARDTMHATVVSLSVESTNSEAKKLYENFGFSSWGIEKNAMKYKGKYFDEIHMNLDLK